jgi:nucleotide-binding universal stress UspA family protein
MNHYPVHKVVVPIDFSDASLAAVDVALQFVGEARQVYLVHVLPLLTDYEAAVVWSDTANGLQQHRSEGILRERLPGPKYADVNVQVRFGDPGHEIAACAHDVGADLIVIPSHGRRGWSHLLIGSVAERVVRLAACPVLVLKPPKAKHVA